MEVSILILSGLAGIGYYLNNERDRENIILSNSAPVAQLPMNPAMYEKPDTKVSVLDTLKPGKKNPTGVPGKNYHTVKKKVLGSSQDGLKKNKRQVVSHTLDPVGAVYERVPEEMGGFAGISRNNEVKRENYIPANFHNNMVPFFRGSSPKQDMRLDYNHIDRVNGNPRTKPKVERKSFHQISQNKQIITGTELPRGATDRMDKIVSHKNQGELLQQPINVAPSTSGYAGTLGHEGFHPWYRQQERTVDELRYGAKPKQSLDDRKRVPIAKGTYAKGTLRPEFHQNHPPREHALVDNVEKFGNDSGFKYAVPRYAEGGETLVRPDTEVVTQPTTRTTLGDTFYVGTNTGVNREQGYITKNIFNDTNTERTQVGQVNYTGHANNNNQSQVYNLIPQRPTARNTTDSAYTGSGGPTGLTGLYQNRDNVYNSEINALKTLTQWNRDPHQERSKLAAGVDKVHIDYYRNIREDLHKDAGGWRMLQSNIREDTDSQRPINATERRGYKPNDYYQNLIETQGQSNPYVIKHVGLQPTAKQNPYM
jgi:hypothetical protein